MTNRKQKENNKSKKNRKRYLYPVLIILFACFIYIIWGNTVIETTYVDIIDSKIPDGFSGFTIVHISDLHNAEFGEKQERLIKNVEKLSPDIIAITGDLIDSSHTDIGIAMDFIYGAVEIAPVYYVTGNHEAWILEQYAELKQLMVEAGVIVLENDIATLENNGDIIYVLGVNDPNFYVGSDETVIEEAIDNLRGETEGYTILLSHRPELFATYCATGVNLVLSGHAHGGQIRLPLIGGIIAPNQGFFPKYTDGLYKSGNTKMVVSRGLGASIIPIRVNNNPEIIAITLKNSDS